VSELVALEREVATCTRCRLAAGRTQTVFGAGDPHAGLMLVGEAPGAEEDRLGVPFVGRSGQLLDRVLFEETGLQRSEVWVGNVLRCRPPGNRNPLDDEIASCRPYLDAQLDLIRPAVIVTLGNFAAQLLLATKDGVTRLRGQQHRWRDCVLVPTFHPAYILRNGGGDALVAMRADFVRAKQAMVAAERYPYPAAVVVGHQPSQPAHSAARQP